MLPLITFKNAQPQKNVVSRPLQCFTGCRKGAIRWNNKLLLKS